MVLVRRDWKTKCTKLSRDWQTKCTKKSKQAPAVAVIMMLSAEPLVLALELFMAALLYRAKRREHMAVRP